MTLDPRQAVITCDAPGCTYRLYAMSTRYERRWEAVGGVTLQDGAHACYRHANKEGTDPS